MVIGNDPSALGLAADAQGVERLKQLARDDPRAALRETARQFEALLMGTLLKNMREATSQDGLFDNEQTRLYTSLLDQQLAQTLSKTGIGLAPLLERQLAASAGLEAQDAPPATLAFPNTPAPAVMHRGRPMQAAAAPPASLALKPAVSAPQAPAAAPDADVKDVAGAGAPAHVRDFVERMLPHARAASEATGIPARFLIGHAALESGWGRHEIRNADGSPTHNLFGIKADRGWRGAVAEVLTTEYIGGMPVQRLEQFRAYASYGEAFGDYGRFLKDNPRYAEALDATHSARAFARELQRAGYATDPRYADQLAAVIDGRSLARTIVA